MKHGEKKYRVEDFTGIITRLNELGATKSRTSHTTHYYAQQEGKDVTKLVESLDGYEIHLLQETDGKFVLVERIPLTSREEGFAWLKQRGFRTLGVVQMEHTDYNYGDGVIGLYTLDGFFHSVIVDFPLDQQQDVQEKLALQDVEVITIPYNKYLERLGKLQTLSLE